MDEGFARGAHPLVVFGHASIVRDPCECSLRDPTAWQVLEARARGQLAKIHLVPLLEPFPSPDLQNLLGWGLGGAIDYLDLHAKCLLDPILAPTSVARVHPQVRKPRQTRTSRFEQTTDAVLVWDLRAVHLGFDHQTLGVHQQMPLPAADILASVEAPLLAAYPGALGLLCASTIPALGSGSL